MLNVTAWLFGLMLWAAPPEIITARPQYPGWEESAAQRRQRYWEIALDLGAVAYDPEVKPLFGGSRGRARTAALLLALAYKESGLARDADLGPCYRGRDGRSTRCDSGRSACMVQRNIGQDVTPEGWSQADLFGDRQKCFRSGLEAARRSHQACGRFGQDHALDVYASGSCAPTDGRMASAGMAVGFLKGRERLAYARKLLDHDAVPGPDRIYLPALLVTLE